MKRLNNRRVFGGGSNWMSRKKRTSSSPPETIATAVSVTPKTFFIEDGAESVISSIRTQSSQEQSISGFTPLAKKRRNTFGSRKAPHVYDSVTDDIFFSPSVLCRKNTVYTVTKEKNTSDNNTTTSSSPSYRADKSSQLSGTFLFNVTHKAQVIADPNNDSVNGSLISEGSSITGISESSEPQVITKDTSSQNNEFDFDDTTTIHSTAASRRIKQPSSTMTSFDEARAYFAQLDASPLLIETAADDLEPRRRNVVRTRRRLLPTHPMVKREYRDYENACADAQVPAMSLEDYSRNRKKFQAQDVLYEGFLDAED